MTDIYQREDLLEIYKDPSNWGSVENPTVEVIQQNPMCGDVLKIGLSIKDGVIKDIKYEGDACSVSIISASLVTEEFIGRSLQEFKDFTKQDVLDLIGVPLTTSRIKCATLILEGINQALSTYESNNK